ncbi:16S rRNA (cytidine(1402)-2'-O)-methyltransferase [Longispora albida]|uniref:16S rRNA (cytidine(1402)-2'-O)-methyltransferase n=1 Tax=Longispora albida TaxID=203523 RepID=UPI0003A7FB32|nr:16S rRNA (cytidine(1402)-2'-O)-methyltransferase [Longispora albida]
MSGQLVLVGAPLGNLGDASPRLAAALAEADVVAAEDTRRLLRLARDLGVEIKGKIISYFEGNEEKRTPELAALLTDGLKVALVTDGGMPSVSDPGYRLVRAAIDAGVPVTVAPGPSAVTTALALSGLPCDRFCFEGFLPRKPNERRSALAALAREPRTLVFFESPHRIAGALRDLAGAFGAEREAAVCRELTKTYEEVRRGGLAEVAAWAEESQPRGEITIVVAGFAGAAERPSDEALRAEVAERVTGGMSKRDAAAEVAELYGLPRREVYNLAIGG